MQLYGRGVTCVRGGREIFAGLDFALAAGTALAITGANGAGKSSLLRIIAGLLPISGGTVALEGSDTELTLAEQAHYLGHRDPIKGALTARENLAFWQDYLGGGDGEDLAASLKAAGLGHVADLPAAYLSAGQRRRLSMARLLAVKRPLWLLDEPTSALDTAGQAIFAAIMTAHLDAGGLIAAATHTPLGIAAQELRIGGAI
ncbi:MAG: heme ABC exporter ATP-binding protein CcmA [Rhizobiales bacterium]|nr:heme ABC exporter ATP-binding protein CcmA [Hyphomicrobiales bacterium]